mmetsp:Transcript_1888/g.4276  ORF Transcript_1888/g.4276 Transcript_1888/m.4276 type:complete len:291 (-) Transcript_1888:827-1699(-)
MAEYVSILAVRTRGGDTAQRIDKDAEVELVGGRKQRVETLLAAHHVAGPGTITNSKWRCVPTFKLRRYPIVALESSHHVDRRGSKPLIPLQRALDCVKAPSFAQHFCLTVPARVLHVRPGLVQYLLTHIHLDKEATLVVSTSRRPDRRRQLVTSESDQAPVVKATACKLPERQRDAIRCDSWHVQCASICTLDGPERSRRLGAHKQDADITQPTLCLLEPAGRCWDSDLALLSQEAQLHLERSFPLPVCTVVKAIKSRHGPVTDILESVAQASNQQLLQTPSRLGIVEPY